MLAGHANAITRRTGAGALDVGRAPWYDSEECSVKSPLIIGVTGGTASGKTTVCSRVKSRLQTPWVSLISMDSFYRPLTADERAQANAGAYNFDGPMAVDWDLFLAVLKDIKLGKSVQIPEYCFRTHSRFVRMSSVETRAPY